MGNTYTGKVLAVPDFEVKKSIIDSILFVLPNLDRKIGFGDTMGDKEMLDSCEARIIVAHGQRSIPVYTEGSRFYTDDGTHMLVVLRQYLAPFSLKE